MERGACPLSRRARLEHRLGLCWPCFISPTSVNCNTNAPLLSPRSSVSLLSQAGSWEEKNVSNWAQERLRELLLEALQRTAVWDATLPRIDVTVTSCTGDAALTVVRGRPRHGFDLAVKLTWKAALSDEREMTGTAELPDASRSSAEDGDLEFVFSLSRESVAKARADAAEEAAVKAAVQLLRADALRALQKLNSEMAAKATPPS